MTLERNDKGQWEWMESSFDKPKVGSVTLVTKQDQYEKAKDALQTASTALLALKNRFGVIPDDIYYMMFDTPIVLMENKLAELMGEDDE